MGSTSLVFFLQISAPRPSRQGYDICQVTRRVAVAGLSSPTGQSLGLEVLPCRARRLTTVRRYKSVNINSIYTPQPVPCSLLFLSLSRQ
ncbi:hypothetical protein ASPBRDRAFT_426993 [Aspergillus brasiliensis CBS 101740]|uniref:Uncharacterized protein n=1 Tax=Aspergillus brasiliensis (strain CBS 101740 / IMI 381727 / IBT 21946) TaxID=767769 RepID=A0A1L9U430_ASPBC|nr:hypothetical protein ASPBRDRAFT_426993 [Aspergillus brasiliensis CBS 101740]